MTQTQIRTPEEAVARIAYLTSDVVISVQPSLSQDSAFSPHLKQLSESKTPGIVSKTLPEVQPIRHNNDPFLSVFSHTASGKLVSVTTSASVLLPSISHLYKLAASPVVIHVALEPAGFPDFAPITSIRNSGWAFLQSQTVQEAQDIALSAHALALRSGKGVIHFFPQQEALSWITRDLPINALDTTVVTEILDLDNARRHQAARTVWQGIYASERSGEATAEQQQPQHPTGLGDAPFDAVFSALESSRVSLGSQHPSVASTPRSPSSDATTIEPSAPAISSADMVRFATAIWDGAEAKLGRRYRAFEYDGPPNAESCIFVFGSSAQLFLDAVNANADGDSAKTGVLTARLYRPWLGTQLLAAIPKTVKKIAVLEQLHTKTTKWGPVLLDVLTSVKSGFGGVETIVGHQLGYISSETAASAFRAIVENLGAESPTHQLQVGSAQAPGELSETHENNGLVVPRVESAYTKILDQLFGDSVFIANRLSSENAGVSISTKASPEYGFGSLLARRERRSRFISDVRSAAASSSSFESDAPRNLLARWLGGANADSPQANELASDVISSLEADGSALASELLSEKRFFRKESLWLVGSDAWAYDLGNSGVHHVLASGQNVNMLIIDSTPYSERAAADAQRRKKDIGLYAMNFGNVYVASVAVYGSYTQVLQAMLEADRFDGPSVVLAYLPYFDEQESALTVLQETKKAVDLGYWPLYRWNPDNEKTGGGGGEPNFALDSERIKQELKSFLDRDNQLTQMMKAQPDLEASLAQDFGTEIRQLQRRKAKDAYNKLVEGLFGAPLTILYASDNGNAASVAKRLGNRGRARGLKTVVMAMEDYPVDDLASEENIVFIPSTAGQGEFPQNGRPFWDAVKDKTDLDLGSVRYSVFGLGDSHYWPRKEDRIYYNKPAKDLDRVLANLGARRLVGIGLGDDQDPDGYQTGYQEWEPKLWDALNVVGQVVVDEEPPPVTNEDIKLASNYLRGTIAEGLADATTGAIAAGDQQLTKFHGTYMQDDRDIREERKALGLEPAYSFMIRCRLPGGVSTPTQWLQMDDISATLGNETMKLTTRQTFQFHGVIKSKLKPAMQAINRALMTTLAACGDVNRNVMCSPLPNQSAYHREVYECSRSISDHLLPSTTAYHEIWLTDHGHDGNKTKVQVAGDALQDFEPLYGPTYLPRKFKIAIAIPPHNDTDVYAHDVGLVAIKGQDGHLAGFNLTAGGGMGATHNNKKTYPQIGRMLGFVKTQEVHRACEHIMTVQRDHGDRKNRKHARLKYTIDDMGVDAFRAKVEERWGQKFQDQRPFAFESNIDTFGWQRDETGMNHFTVFIENGRVEDTADFQMKTGLREVARALLKGGRGGEGEFRLTANQHVIISNVADDQLDAVKELLGRYGLDNLQHSGLRLGSSACVAFPTCGLAMAESERYLPVLISKLESCLEENGLRQDSIVMRMTGCPNGCARPWLAEVAFVGKAYGAYNMYLGGGYHGQRLNKLYRSSIKEGEILATMKPLLKRYAIERTEGERFGDFCIRAGIIKATREGRDFHDDVAEEESDE